jgi:hypothetical protein
MELRHHVTRMTRQWKQTAAVVVAAGFIAPLAMIAATPSTAGAVDFYCVGGLPRSFEATLGQSVDTLNTLGSSAGVNFTSTWFGVNAGTQFLYSAICVSRPVILP